MSLYRGCSLMLNGFDVPNMVNYSPPEIATDTRWFKAGAMNAPVPVDCGTKAMTATYKCVGMDYGSILLFGAIPGIRARLSVRRAYRGVLNDSGVTYLDEEVEGMITSVKSDDQGGDNKAEVGQLIAVSASYYKISTNLGVPLLEISPIHGLRKILGVNVLGIPNNILNLIL